jgi:hypothetical protein
VKTWARFLFDFGMMPDVFFQIGMFIVDLSENEYLRGCVKITGHLYSPDAKSFHDIRTLKS